MTRESNTEGKMVRAVFNDMIAYAREIFPGRLQKLLMCRILLLVSLVLVHVPLSAGSGAVASSHARRVIDEGDRVVLRGNVHPLAQTHSDQGSADISMPMQRMILLIGRRRGASKKLERLLAQQQDPHSPSYHRWLTPEEFGRRFGVGDEDLEDVLGWLHHHGFTIDEVAKARGWINFSGNVAQVEEAFHTQIHTYRVGEKVHHANAVDPSIPRGLADVVGGIVTLHDFHKRPAHSTLRRLASEKATPSLTVSDGSHYLTPADFATIYNVSPLYSAGINGAGQTIAIVGRTDIALSDVRYFRSIFGLPANDPVFINNGPDPGNLGGNEEEEADLDVEWSGALAPYATIELVTSQSTSTTDGVELSAQFIVNNNLAPVMSTSFGRCESIMSTTAQNFYNMLWQQAAAQGITAFVSAGDSGASGCEGGSANTGTGVAVSGLCSTPFNVCVGGTEFLDGENPSAYWSSGNDPNTHGSALSYIPEGSWNESGIVAGGSGLWATGGGASRQYAKPLWQVAPGVPADGMRDVPDVSLAAAGHDGYIIVHGNSFAAVRGTSASSPSFAGLMALVVQDFGAQGNANTVFYAMGYNQYANGGTAVFHDITSGNNSVPGVTGYSCGPGYDPVNGLGSVDATAMVSNWGLTSGGVAGGGVRAQVSSSANSSRYP